MVTINPNRIAPQTIEKNPTQKIRHTCIALTLENLRFVMIIHIGSAMIQRSTNKPTPEFAQTIRPWYPGYLQFRSTLATFHKSLMGLHSLRTRKKQTRVLMAAMAATVQTSRR